MGSSLGLGTHMPCPHQMHQGFVLAFKGQNVRFGETGDRDEGNRCLWGSLGQAGLHLGPEGLQGAEWKDVGQPCRCLISGHPGHAISS